MNVSELIKELEKVEDKSKDIFFRVDLPLVELGMNDMRIEKVIDGPNPYNRIVLSGNYERNKQCM